MRILIVDDNERVRRGVSMILSAQADWEICGEAKDGAEAIVKARDLLPDVILLDISMPGLSGLEVARKLRQECSQSKILIMSQHDPLLLMPRAREAGVDGCVDKNLLDMDLLDSIKNLGRNQQVHRVQNAR